LGSSACVLVSIVGAILSTLFATVSENEINCVSQVANIAAQNKIGSNFDISTAIFGSHLYKNKLPKKAFEVAESNGMISKLF
jgi:phosphomevalonate kinase